jgi:hypothetical protein
MTTLFHTFLIELTLFQLKPAITLIYIACRYDINVTDIYAYYIVGAWGESRIFKNSFL